MVELSDLTNFFDGEPGDPLLSTPEEGQSVGFAPEFSYVLNAHYERPISADLTLSTQANWSWRDDFAQAGALPFDDGVYTVEGYGLLGASISVESSTGWRASLIGENLTDNAYAVQATGDDLLSYVQPPGRPRSWQIQITKRF